MVKVELNSNSIDCKIPEKELIGKRHLTPEEIQILMNSGFAPVHFAGNILRCETAAIYGLAAVQCVVNKF